jgi:hypothetical protein
MNCFICGAEMQPYFSKSFNTYNLGNVEYCRCVNCGFVLSKTHAEMSALKWELLNDQYHRSYHGSGSCPDDPNWVRRLKCQARTINELVKVRILSTKLPWVDYGSGDGKLADMLTKNMQLKVNKFDKYSKQKDFLSYETLIGRKYSVVINCSVFEHILSLPSLQEITSLVADDGVFALHTLAREEIPKDPGWFYLLPVHCAFYTNRSMEILFANLGFNASVYHVDSRMWFWFRKNGDRVRQILHTQKNRMKGEYHFKFGFVDYWK